MNQAEHALPDAPLILRSHFRGELLLGDRAASIAYIRHPARPLLVARVERWMLDEPEATLGVPDAQAASLQLHVTLHALDPADQACDRWTAYHLSSAHRVWGALEIVAGKLEVGGDRAGAPADRAHVMTADDLLAAARRCADESALCRSLNADRAGLRRACEAATCMNLSDALCVGVDDLGIDVRTSFGPVRLDARARPRLEFNLGDDTFATPESGPDFVAAIRAAAGATG